MRRHGACFISLPSVPEIVLKYIRLNHGWARMTVHRQMRTTISCTGWQSRIFCGRLLTRRRCTVYRTSFARDRCSAAASGPASVSRPDPCLLCRWAKSSTGIISRAILANKSMQLDMYLHVYTWARKLCCEILSTMYKRPIPTCRLPTKRSTKMD